MTAIPRSKSIRNPAEYPVLGILLGGPLHGYEMCRRLGEGIGSIWRLGKSQIYALLAKLEREGLVIHERVGQDNLPAKNIFSLTPEGGEVVKEWLEQPVHHIRDMRLEFLTKLWFARQASPDRERLLIEKQLGVCREKAKVLERLKESCGNQVEALSIDFRVTVIKATVSWLEDLLDSIEIGNPNERKRSVRSEKKLVFTFALVNLVLALLISGASENCFAADSLMVFAGAASKPPTEEAAKAFEAKTGVKVDVIFGGSGYVLSQMMLGKKGDIYFPGSSDYMELAKKKDVVFPETEKNHRLSRSGNQCPKRKSEERQNPQRSHPTRSQGRHSQP